MKKKFTIKASRDAIRRRAIKASDSAMGYPYLYVLKHGYGPGTLPRDVEVGRVEDYNGYTLVWLDRFLTTSELRDYDIPSETQLDRYLGNDVDRFMKMGGSIKSSRTIKRVSASKRMRRPVKASAYDEDIVMYFNGKKIYEGLAGGYMYDAVYDICKDDSTRLKIQEWCNQFGGPLFDDEFGDADETTYTFCSLVYDLFADGDDYIDGDGILNIEIFPKSEEVNGSKSIECGRRTTSMDEFFEDELRKRGDDAESRATRKAYHDAVKSNRFSVDLFYTKNSGLADEGFFNDWSDVEEFAHDGLMKGLYVSITDWDTGKVLDISPDEYIDAFDGDFDVNEDIVRFKRDIVNSSTRISAARDTTVDKEAVRELVLYITNKSDLYPQVQSIVKNMQRKIKQGKYDDELAVKAWQYLADAGVEKYDKEFGSGNGTKSMLNKATREQIARELRDYFADEVNDGVEASQSVTCSQDISGSNLITL